ncbi:MAG: nucleotidyltransferase domain-containing protein [Actinomycetota bacterium]|nr:nucleotidyltransferase domain-containing protein [Actinomycetota bacterium]MDQ3573368.1 nucleotidyltransferase domain-containing protein [Actinomycetota bacterium]
MTVPGLAVDMERLREICSRYGVSRLEVFGSVSRGEDALESDIDLGQARADQARYPEGWAVQLEQTQELAPRLPEPALEQSLGMDLGR